MTDAAAPDQDPLKDPLFVLRRLEATIAERKADPDPTSSHTAKMLAKGPSKCAQKFGEEAVEAVIAAAERDLSGMVSETADALYHLLIMLAAQDVSLNAVLAELQRREGVSGVTEKAARKETLVKEAASDADLADCLRIRRIVFVEEQGVPEAEEMDGQEDLCRHFLALQDGAPVAAARLKPVETPDLGPAQKIQRVAVLAKARGTGAGREIMRALVDAAGSETLVLDSQSSAIGFYEPLGFIAEGPEFIDAGIPHRRMILRRGPR